MLGGSGSLRKFSFTIQHLKVVELCGHYGRRSDIELVKYFVENAVAVEKMRIYPLSQSILPCCRPQTEREIKKEQDARTYAQPLEGLIPSNIEFVIL